jgi:hypothetical protein
MHWPNYLADRGDADGLRQRADAGYESAARRLGPLLTSRAKVGDEAAAKELEERADAGDIYADHGLARLAQRVGRNG